MKAAGLGPTPNPTQQQTGRFAVWRLLQALFPGMLHIDAPHVIAVPLRDEQQNCPQRRERQVCQTGLVVQPYAQARIELADALPMRVGGGISTGKAGLPAALRLRVLQRRRRRLRRAERSAIERLARGAELAARRERSRRLGRRRLVGCEVHGARRATSRRRTGGRAERSRRRSRDEIDRNAKREDRLWSAGQKGGCDLACRRTGHDVEGSECNGRSDVRCRARCLELLRSESLGGEG
jgi:hypothetical protein